MPTTDNENGKAHVSELEKKKFRYVDGMHIVTLSDANGNDLLLNNDGSIFITSVNNGTVDTNNSSTIPLPADTGGSDHIFTGAATRVLDFVEARVAPYSDVASAIDGLSIQYSMDGINWDHDDVYTIPAATGKNYQVQRIAEWYRIVYTNGTVAQDEFRLSTIQNRVHSQHSSHRLKDNIVGDDDATLNTSVIKVQTNNPMVYKNASVQDPLPTDGDQVFAKDLDIDFCTAADFIKDGDATISEENVINSIVSDIYNEKLNSTSDAIKTIFLQFKRPVLTSSFGINAGPGGDFSNVKITLAQGDSIFVAVDESADSTKHEINLFPIPPVKFSRMTIEFHTTDPISIGLVGIFKNTEVAARLQALSDLTNAIEDIGSFRGALNVNTALVHKQGINEYFQRDIGGSTTLATAPVAGSTSFDVDSATGFAISDLVRLEGQRGYFKILNIVSVTITINRPLDSAMSIGDDMVEIDISLNKAGTLAAPISHKVMPPSDERWQMTRLLVTMLDSSAMDDGRFGGASPLTNGLILRISRAGIVSTVTVWFTNQDLKNDMFNVEYDPKAPAGFYGLSGRWTLIAAEFVADLDGATGDYIEILNQDDLTVLDDFKIKAQGRLFGG